jgi:hypothetical protein
MKTVGALRKVKLRGRDKLWWLFTFTAAAFNLWRIPKLQVVARAKNLADGALIAALQPKVRPATLLI